MDRGFERTVSRGGDVALPAPWPCTNHGSVETKSKGVRPTFAHVQRLDLVQDPYVVRRLWTREDTRVQIGRWWVKEYTRIVIPRGGAMRFQGRAVRFGLRERSYKPSSINRRRDIEVNKPPGWTIPSTGDRTIERGQPVRNRIRTVPPEVVLIMVSGSSVSGRLADNQRARNRLRVAHQQNSLFGPTTTRIQMFTLGLFRTVRRTHRSSTSRKYSECYRFTPLRYYPRPYLRFVILEDFPLKIILSDPSNPAGP